MGPWIFTSLLVLTLFSRPSLAALPEPNTDEFFVYVFFQKMRRVAPSDVSEQSGSICSWKGVYCDNQGGQRVTGIVASGVGLTGVIPDNTLGKLNKLQHLDLSRNSITGLSSDFWGLGNSIKSLNLSSNQINGSLPNNIGNFGLVEILDLSHNYFSGEMPTTFGSLRSLKHLNLSRNSFSGGIPGGFLSCLSLTSVDLSDNGLSGGVPSGLSSALRNLNVLNLAGNKFKGKLPDFSKMVSITYLNLSGNMFQGSVLGIFNSPLQIIDLSRNQLTGHISQVNSRSSVSWSSLAYLDISGNQFSGDIFGNLNEAKALKHLNLGSNRFSRRQFPSMDKLTALEYLNMSRTSITGVIPTYISELTSLKTLDLSHNHLIGHVPDFKMTNLKVLDLSWNNLSGEIPSSLQEKLKGMSKFDFSYNNLSLCSAQFSPEMLGSAFLGTQSNCPIAANPDLLRRRREKNKGLILALVIALSALLLMAGLFCLLIGCRRRTRRWEVKQMSYREEPNISGPFSFQTDSTTWVADVKAASSVPVVIFEKPLLNFTFADLLSATSHFDRGTLLAEGRFGPVYRGFLPGGIHVAVKVLVHGSTLTDHETVREFEHLGQIKHANLVPLTGYCIAGDQRIAIYEYMENGNLQNLLYDLPLGIQRTEDWSADTWEEDNDGGQSITSEGQSTWRFRHKIALGAARALAFLHHGCIPQIVHRDVKASSIYLDSAFEPRLSDFGLAKIFGGVLENEITRGSPGYMPPEFSGSESCSATTKTDVYGFGVVLFELITGKKPTGDKCQEERDTNLVNWVRGLVRKNKASEAIDPKIRETGLEKQMEEALRIGYLCTAEAPAKRPSMQQVVGLLKDIEPSAIYQ